VIINQPLLLPNFNVYDYLTLVSATVDFGDSTTAVCLIYGTSPSFYVACPQTHTYTTTGYYYLTFFISDTSQYSIFVRSTYVSPPSLPTFYTNPVPLSPISLLSYESIPQFAVQDTYAPITTATVAYGDNFIATCTLVATSDQYTWNVNCPQTYLYPATGTYTVTFFIEDTKGQTALYTSVTTVTSSNIGVTTSVPQYVVTSDYPTVKCFTTVSTDIAYVRYYTILYGTQNTPNEYIQPSQYCLVLSPTSVCCPPPTVMAKLDANGQVITYGAAFYFCGASLNSCEPVTTTFSFI